jgi:1-deoxy-D-xylulose-5-phosphate reductoisomerase
MRTPIAHALAWPGRMDSGVAFLDFARLVGAGIPGPGFHPVSRLRLAYEAALAAGGTASGDLNAANEVAVQAFLEGGFAIYRHSPPWSNTLEQVAGRSG